MICQLMHRQSSSLTCEYVIPSKLSVVGASCRSPARKGLLAAKTSVWTGMFLPWQSIRRSVLAEEEYRDSRAPAMTREWELHERVLRVAMFYTNKFI